VKTLKAVALQLLLGGSLVAQTVAGPRRIDLAGLSTKATGVQAGSVVNLELPLDPIPSGGDVIDVATHNPSPIVSLVRPDGVVVTAANAASLGL
jgi:hypothetical protein